MSSWLEKLLSPATAKKSAGTKPKTNLPAKMSNTTLPSTILTNLNKLELTKGLPPAAIIYGSASGAFFAFALILFITGHWADGLITLLPTACFMGFAHHIAKHTHPKR